MAQILATGYQRAGKESAVVTGGLSLAYSSWDASARGDRNETSNFLDYVVATGFAYKEGIINFIECTGTFGGDWDAHHNPVDLTADVTPPGLWPRDDLPDTQLYVSIVDITFWNFPYLFITTADVGTDVKGNVTMKSSYNSQGVFHFPTGSV